MVGRTTGGGVIWLAAAAGLSGLIAVELTQDLPLTPAVIAAVNETAAGDAASASPPAANLPSKGLIDAIVERPLFSPSRRPAVAAPADETPPEEAEEASLPWELVGTLLTGETPLALMRHPIEGLVRLRRGQTIGDWTITAIQEKQVRLENGDRLETLTLQKDRIRPARPASGRDRSKAGTTPGITSAASGQDDQATATTDRD